jgi:isopenicillin N synthase-like dioxygenase
LPKEEKKKFRYDSGEGMGVGYELKETSGTTLDLKEDLHFTAERRKWLWDEAAKFADPDVHNLITWLDELRERIAPMVIEFARAMGEVYDMPHFMEDVEANAPQWFIRLLHYFPGAELGEEIAKAHADKSGFTLHLYESHAGFEYLDYSRAWREVNFSPDTTVILPGMRGQHRSEGRLKATFHRVVATPETAREGRYSAVLFVHPANTPEYDKARAGRPRIGRRASITTCRSRSSRSSSRKRVGQISARRLCLLALSISTYINQYVMT